MQVQQVVDYKILEIHTQIILAISIKKDSYFVHSGNWYILLVTSKIAAANCYQCQTIFLQQQQIDGLRSLFITGRQENKLIAKSADKLQQMTIFLCTRLHLMSKWNIEILYKSLILNQVLKLEYIYTPVFTDDFDVYIFLRSKGSDKIMKIGKCLSQNLNFQTLNQLQQRKLNRF